MRVLLDECVDRRLASAITGHEIRTVPQMGWTGIENGRLIELAQENFEVLVTMDKNFPTEHALPSRLAMVLLRARSNRIVDLQPLVPELLMILSDCPPGKVYVVGESA